MNITDIVVLMVTLLIIALVVFYMINKSKSKNGDKCHSCSKCSYKTICSKKVEK